MELDSEIALDRPVRFTQANPRRAGTRGALRYDAYKLATTIRQAMQLGAQRGDIVTDLDRCLVTFLDGSPPPSTGRKRPGTEHGNIGATAKKAREVGDCTRKSRSSSVSPSVRYSFPKARDDVRAEAEYEIFADGAAQPPIDRNQHTTIRIRGPANFVKDPEAIRARVMEAIEASVDTLEELHVHHFDVEKPADIIASIANLLNEAKRLRVLGFAYCQISPEALADCAAFVSIQALDLRGSIDVKYAANRGISKGTSNAPYTTSFKHVASSIPELISIDLDGILEDDNIQYCIDTAALRTVESMGVKVNLGGQVHSVLPRQHNSRC